MEQKKKILLLKNAQHNSLETIINQIWLSWEKIFPKWNQMFALWSPVEDRQQDSESSEECSNGVHSAIAVVNTAASPSVLPSSFIMTRA